MILLQASFFPAIGQGSDRAFAEIKKSTIISYEFFVNNPVTPDPSSRNTLPEDAVAEPPAAAEQKPTAIETVPKKAEDQMLSRGLGRSVSEEEVELLTRVIHGEARGEKFEGQVAVGAVVLNRVKDSRFPNTIRGVIYQSGAFTAVDDKQIHLNPNDQSYKAAKAALSGQDPTNGALFYYNPHLATDNWIKSRAVVKRIGNHIFGI